MRDQNCIWDSSPVMDPLALSLVREDLYNLKEVEFHEQPEDEDVWRYYLERYLPDEFSDLEQRLNQGLPGTVVVVMSKEKPLIGEKSTTVQTLSRNLNCVLRSFVEDSDTTHRVFADSKDIRAEEIYSGGHNRYCYRMLLPDTKGKRLHEFIEEIANLQSNKGCEEILGKYTTSLLPIVEQIFQWKYR